MPEDIKKLKIWTSCSTEDRFNELVENNILPIIIIGISKSSPLAKWRNTMIHYLNLGPNQDLWKKYVSGEIGRDEFKNEYLHDLWRRDDVFKTLRQFDILTHLSRATGLCILSGLQEDDPTRETIAEYFNKLGILENVVEEWKP